MEPSVAFTSFGILLGIIFTCMCLLIFTLTISNKSLKNEVDSLKKYREKFSKRKNKLRKGIYQTKWFNVKDKEINPNNYASWSTTFTVQELGEKTGNKTKVEIIDCFCSDRSKLETLDYYKNWLNDKYGGYVDLSNIEWIETKSKDEIRGEKLEEILSSEDTDKQYS